ncbi:hypothetical protein ISN44_As10g000800 [Arabidopsis suecica]|uniref:Uncharacterized protein n=1 Tax=Arabidopsis suecica TaxID=45249 RepID=A0A8T1ZT91_ARASU|nr:hypothetical protein ISN44_As10g000800 [Arabidopsis suecica]
MKLAVAAARRFLAIFELDSLLLRISLYGGVRTTITTFKDVDVYDVEYCACDKLRRHVLSKDGSIKVGGFEDFKKAKENVMFKKKVGAPEGCW